MKWNKQLFGYLVLFIAAAALYRIVPSRPFGFAPQIAMALFGGAVLKDTKWAFALPLFSMFISDALYQVLYLNGLSSIKGFYSGQLLNYAVMASVVVLGFFMKKINLASITGFSFLAPTWFFLLSNFTVWAGSDGSFVPLTWEGLVQTYVLGIPFYKASIAATYVFSAVFFSAWYLMTRSKAAATTA
jgi:hypothetical protein